MGWEIGKLKQNLNFLSSSTFTFDIWQCDYYNKLVVWSHLMCQCAHMKHGRKTKTVAFSTVKNILSGKGGKARSTTNQNDNIFFRISRTILHLLSVIHKMMIEKEIIEKRIYGWKRAIGLFGVNNQQHIVYRNMMFDLSKYYSFI